MMKNAESYGRDKWGGVYQNLARDVATINSDLSSVITVITVQKDFMAENSMLTVVQVSPRLKQYTLSRYTSGEKVNSDGGFSEKSSPSISGGHVKPVVRYVSEKP
jgi:hypothetical protein